MSEVKKIDYKRVFKEILNRRKCYYKVLPTVFILSCLFIICIPRTYTSDTEVVPETESGASSAGGLASLASTLGFDFSAIESTDAITPIMYPNLLKDNGFISDLLKIRVRTLDGKIEDTLFNYVYYHEKGPWWSIVQSYIINLFKSSENGTGREMDPYAPTKKEFDAMEKLRGHIKLKVDKKTGSIYIETTTQDALVSKVLADSVREHLQRFIIKYRTKKASNDVKYYSDLVVKAKIDYEESRKAYSRFADRNMNSNWKEIASKSDAMEKDAEMLYNNYSILNTQLPASKAKLQERTPAFMLVKGASVPLKPSGPKRMIFVLVMTILAFCGTTIYVLRDIIS